MSSSLAYGLPALTDVRVVAGAAVLRDDLGEHFAVRAIDRLDRGFVAEPGELHLVETHRLDDARIVGRIEGLHLYADRLRQGVDEGFPVLLLVHRGFGRDHAEVDLGRSLRMRDREQRKRAGHSCQRLHQHRFHSASPVVDRGP
jgi:hypothetical protein